MNKLILTGALALFALPAYAAQLSIAAGTTADSIAFKDGTTEVVVINPDGTVEGATPTANNHLATKEYVDTQTASASGSSMPTYAGVTSSSYEGEAGLGTMDSACNTQYPGSRMARTSELMRMIIEAPSQNAWVYCDEFISTGSGVTCTHVPGHDGDGDILNCDGFSSNSSTNDGIYVNASSGAIDSSGACNTSRRAYCVYP